MRKRNYSTGIKHAFENYRWWDYKYMIDFEIAIWKDWFKIYSEKKLTMAEDSYSNERAHIAKLALSLLEISNGYFMEKVNPDDNIIFEETSEGFSRVTHFPELQLQKGLYVNTRNSGRFLREECKKHSGFLSELRCKKAWYLYNKLRAYKLHKMWD